MPKSPLPAGRRAPDRSQPEPPARVATCLVELVLSAGEFGPQAEPALRQLRAALERHQPVVGGDASGDSPSRCDEPPVDYESGTILRTGMAVTQEFGKLDVTLRALVSTRDLIQGATVGAEHLRAAIGGLRAGTEAEGPLDGLPFLEQSVRASWS